MSTESKQSNEKLAIDGHVGLAADKIEITLNCTRQHLSIVLHALDFFSRIGIGQLESILEHESVDKYLFDKFRDGKKIDWDKTHDLKDELRNRINQMKLMLFNMAPNASHGIHSRDVADENRIAYDLQQVLRHELWKIRAGHAYTVDAAPARQSSSVELPTAKIVCR